MWKPTGCKVTKRKESQLVRSCCARVICLFVCLLLGRGITLFVSITLKSDFKVFFLFCSLLICSLGKLRQVPGPNEDILEFDTDFF